MPSEKVRAVRTTAEEVGLGLEGEEGFSTLLPLLSLLSLSSLSSLLLSLSYFICKIKVRILEACGVTSPAFRSENSLERSASFRLFSQARALQAPVDVSPGEGGMRVQAWGSLLLLAGIWGTSLFHFSPRLETGKDAKSRNCFSSRVK